MNIKRATCLAIAIVVNMALPSGPARASEVKPTIVLLHGAWADGSSWDAVVRRLLYCQHTVYVPPNNLRGVAIDSAALADFLGTITGPIVLVGHSYGGTLTNLASVFALRPCPGSPPRS